MPFLLQKLLFGFSVTLLKQLTSARPQEKNTLEHAESVQLKLKVCSGSTHCGDCKEVRSKGCLHQKSACMSQPEESVCHWGAKLLFVWKFCNLSCRHQKEKKQTPNHRKTRVVPGWFFGCNLPGLFAHHLLWVHLHQNWRDCPGQCRTPPGLSRGTGWSRQCGRGQPSAGHLWRESSTAKPSLKTSLQSSFHS